MITAQEIKDITLEYRYTSQTKWDEFIDLIFATAASSYKIKGDIDCSGNPLYPAADVGDVYRVSVAGRIGGALGTKVEPGDLIVAWFANPGGTQAAVGSFWTINQVGLQDIFQITGNDLSFDVVRDLSQSVGRDWYSTTTRDRVETVINDYALIVTGFSTMSYQGGAKIQTLGGAFDTKLFLNVDNSVDWDIFNDLTLAITGNVLETITGDKTLNINSGNYIHFVNGASGSVNEVILGTLAQNIADDRTLIVGVNYTHFIDAPSGDITETSIGTKTENIAGRHSLLSSLINVVNIPAFANDAAAVLGGLLSGDLYYTNVAGDGFVKRVI